MPIRFLKNASEIADVSWESPLPVSEASKERRLVQAERLLVSDTTVDNNANRDILGNTVADQPTLSNCLQYHTLLWTLFKIGADSINYEVLARAVDFSGAPLDAGWRQVATGTITGAANTWHRIAITETNGLYYDQYRIRVQRGGTADVAQRSVIVGVRRCARQWASVWWWRGGC